MKKLFIAIFLIAGCGGTSGSVIETSPPVQGPSGYNSLIKLVINDINCINGGTLLLVGTDKNNNGILEMTEITQSADICNGNNASQPMYTPVIVITPCGSNSSAYKEALLGLSGGGIFSEFSGSLIDATQVRNTLAPDGLYYDTDSSQCNFTISTDLSGNRSVTWNGSSANGSGPYQSGGAYYTSSTQSWIQH